MPGPCQRFSPQVFRGPLSGIRLGHVAGFHGLGRICNTRHGKSGKGGDLPKEEGHPKVAALIRPRFQVTPRYLLQVGGLSLLYWGLAWTGFKTAPAYAFVTSIWFPSGVALAVLLRYGLRYWPHALLGPILFTQTLGVPWHLSLFGGVGDLLSSLVGALILLRWRFDPAMGSFRDTMLFILFGAWLPTLFGGGIGASTLVLGHVAPPSLYFTLFKVWWLADMAGALTLAPLLLAFTDPRPEARGDGSAWEGGALFAFLLLACLVVFGKGSEVFHGDLLPTYVILPFVAWAALRFDLRATSAVVMISSLAAIYGCARNLREADAFRSTAILHLQIFMSVLSSLGLMLSAALQERRKVERDLLENQRFLHGIMDSSPAVIYVKDLDGRYLLTNQRFEQLFGLARGKVKGLRDEDIFPKAEAEAFRTLDQMVVESRQPLVAEERASGEAGSQTYLSIKSPLMDGEGRPFALCGISTDITDRKRAETDLQKTRFALERSLDAMFLLDPQGRILDVNETACTQFECGREKLVGQTLQSLEPSLAAAWPERWRDLRASGSLRVESTHRTGTGRILPVEATYHFYEFQGEEGCLAFFRDLSEHRALEEQLRHSQKMDAVGQLAGGIAHDFNNILSAIGLYSTLALEDLGPDDPSRHSIEGIQLAGQKAASLTRQLLSFSRKQVLQPESVDLGKVLKELEPMLRRLLGETIQLKARVAPGLGRVLADPGLMEQALLNLVVNARDAMPGGGTILMEAAEVTLGEKPGKEPVGIPPGPCVVLRVADTGTGMSPETQAHIFEPFFTTKERGKGTGLGLATVYGIVQQAGGHIWVESEPGRGTTFTLYFPRAAAGEARDPSEPEGVPEQGQGEHLLLVEDEESLRELVAGMLTLRGYQVSTAVDGADAFESFRDGTKPLDLLVTDVIMPKRNGRELADALRRVYPGLKVLYMSGYTAENSVHRGLLEAGVPFLQKPFPPHALLRMAREVLKKS